MTFLTRRKPIDIAGQCGAHTRLKQSLTWPHLVAMGVGAIVGTGIYTLTGIGAGLAGPGVILSFALCGIICGCAALCYAEMATLIPAAGSAYTYSYSVLGEAIAWIVGWSLVLEYTVAAAAVAVGWSGYAGNFIIAAGWHVPSALLHGTMAGGFVDLPAVIIGAVVTVLLIVGTRESAVVNMVLVAIKLLALVLFVILCAPRFLPAHFHPFLPYGLGAHAHGDGSNYGVLGAAAIVFFAFYGFDAVSTAAEETKDPDHNLKIGIIGSMAVSTTIYILVAAAALGACYYTLFSPSKAPLAFVLERLHHPLAAQLVAAAAIIALPSVILVLMFGQSRIFFVMARDGLLPRKLASVHPQRGTPVLMTAVTGAIVIALAATLRLDELAKLANAGTLCAFTAVAICVLVMRQRDPGRRRMFAVPLPWLVAPICIIGCLYLFFAGLPTFTKWWFLVWNIAGFALYLAYGARRATVSH